MGHFHRKIHILEAWRARRVEIRQNHDSAKTLIFVNLFREPCSQPMTQPMSVVIYFF